MPGQPKEVNIKYDSPTTLELAIVPPDDNGGVEIFAFRVEYEQVVLDFLLSEYLGGASEMLRPL